LRDAVRCLPNPIACGCSLFLCNTPFFIRFLGTHSGSRSLFVGVAAHFFWQCLSRYLAKLRRYRSEVLTLSSQ
ncbi:hypothetical protein, partial [Paenibacillus dendritiformis]|uniref:hypothetical protein n=1 Tax=Paenibacillus dendritiformis TaxID=130049 RepID=UPI001BCFAAE0